MRGPSLDVVPRYIQHPPGGASWSPDGAPLDSGTAMIAHSNASVLSYQGARELGHALAPGLVTNVVTDWQDLIDVTPDTTSGTYGLIPWRQDTSAVAIGPYAPSHTRIAADPPGLYPRKVRVVVDVTKNAPFPVDSSLTIMACLVRGQGTPLTAPVLARALAVLTGGVHFGDRSVSLILGPTAPIAPSAAWRSRPASAGIASTTALSALWVWVGWYALDPLDAVWSVSAFEVPE